MVTLNGTELVLVEGVCPNGQPSGVFEQTTTQDIANLGGGGGGGNARLRFVITGNTTAGTAINTDYVYFVNGTATLTLPSAAGQNNLYSVVNIGTGIATVVGLINGVTNYIMAQRYQSATFASNNTSWNIF